MKKLLVLIVIILTAAFYFFTQDDEVKQATNTAATSFEPNPSSATFAFDEGSVTLSDGKGQSEGGSVEMLEQKASGELNADGKADTAVLLASSGGGSGVFIYLAAYVSGPVTYKGTNAIFIGDRISPESVSIDNGVITLKYLDRKLEEPFAAEPTIPVSAQFVYRKGSLEPR